MELKFLSVILGWGNSNLIGPGPLYDDTLGALRAMNQEAEAVYFFFAIFFF